MRRLLVFCATVAVGIAAVAPALAQSAPPRIDGEWVVLDLSDFGNHVGELHRMRPDGSELTNLTNGAGEDTDGELSPDGTAIVFTSNDPTMGQTIWLMDVNGADRRLLRQGAAGSPTWTPDGTTVVFASGSEIRSVDRNGANERLVTEVAGATVRNPSVSPDGVTVVFDAQVDVSREIYAAPMAGGAATALTSEGGFEPAWSHDGSLIAFATFRGDYGDNIYSTRPDGSEQQTLVPSPYNDFHPTWSPDGTRIMFDSVRDDDFTMSTFDRGAGTTTDFLTLAENPRWGRATWTAVTLDAVTVPAVETTTTTAAPTDDSTTTTAVPAPTSDGSGSSSDWLVLALGGAILLLFGFGAGFVFGSRRPDDLPPAAPPPPSD